MRTQTKLGIWAILSTIFLVIAGIAGLISDLMNLSHRLHFLPLVFAVLALAGMIGVVLMWRSYSTAMKQLQETGEARNSATLGPPRSELNLMKYACTMIQKSGIKEVDIGGLALRAAFFRKNGKFGELLLAALRNNRELRVRVWLLDPKSTPAKLRNMAERGQEEGSLQDACRETLETLKDIVQTIWNEQPQKRRPQVVLVDKVAVAQSIFRVDDQMIVGFYLQHLAGSESPTVHLTKENPWFSVYEKQFEHCFNLHSANQFPSDEELKRASRQGISTM